MNFIRACFMYASYWIRPYDMISDRRRWVWQPRTRCGFSYNIRIEEP